MNNKKPKRVSLRRSRWSKRKARFNEIQKYKMQKRELGKIFLFTEKPDRIAYDLAVGSLKKSYGIE